MADLVKTDLIAEVRRKLDEITLSGEEVITNTDYEDLASSNFRDSDIGDRLDRAAIFLAARVKAEYLPNLITTIDPVDFPNTKVLRVLGSRVKVVDDNGDTQYATRRTFLGHRQLEARGLPVDDENPVYILEDNEARVLPDDVSGSATMDVVVVPTDCEDLTDLFENAIIQRTLQSCFLTLQQPKIAQSAQKVLLQEIQHYLIPTLQTKE